MTVSKSCSIYERSGLSSFLYAASVPAPGTSFEQKTLPVHCAADLFQRLSMQGTTLILPTFSIEKFNQRFVSRGCIQIETVRLPSALFRMTIIHHFQLEDTHPDLDQCTAGLFLSPCITGRFAQAEDLQTECRSLFHLGFLDTIHQRIAPYGPA